MRIRTCLAVALFCLPLACGGDSHEALAKEGSNLMGQIATTLEGVTDVKSAEAAATKIKALAPKMESLKTRMDKLGEPSDAMQSKTDAMAGKEMARLQAAVMKHAMNEDIMKVLGPALETLDPTKGK